MLQVSKDDDKGIFWIIFSIPNWKSTSHRGCTHAVAMKAESQNPKYGWSIYPASSRGVYQEHMESHWATNKVQPPPPLPTEPQWPVLCLFLVFTNLKVKCATLSHLLHNQISWLFKWKCWEPQDDKLKAHTQ